jgi:hypothetical protein
LEENIIKEMIVIGDGDDGREKEDEEEGKTQTQMQGGANTTGVTNKIR